MTQRDDDKCNSLRSTKNRCGLLCPPLFCLMFETRRILLGEHPCALRLRIKVDFRKIWSPPDNLTVPSAIRKEFDCFTFFRASVPPSHSLRAWISDASKFSSSYMSVNMMSLFQILPAYNAYRRNIPSRTFLSNWWSIDWSVGEIGWCSVMDPKGITDSLNGSPNRRLYEFSSWRRDLKHFADNSNIPWNQSIAFRPRLITTVLQKLLP